MGNLRVGYRLVVSGLLRVDAQQGVLEGRFLDDLHLDGDLEDPARQPGNAFNALGVQVLFAPALACRRHPVVKLLDRGDTHLVHAHVAHEGEDVQRDILAVVFHRLGRKPRHKRRKIRILDERADRGRLAGWKRCRLTGQNDDPRLDRQLEVLIQQFLPRIPAKPNGLTARTA